MGILAKELVAPEPAPALDAKGSMCVLATVHGSYQDYVPLYVYSVLRSYPDYHVRIFLRETISPANQRALDAIRANLSARFDIQENCFSDLGEVTLTVARWLLPQSAVADFEYAYIGDVDYIICRETPDIRARHVGYCREQGLPYSNGVRVKGVPVRRLTGLHFIMVREYYSKMEPVIDRVKARLRLGDPASSSMNDENLLYDIVEEGIGRFPPKWFRPDHGIHLGTIRTGRAKGLECWAPYVLGELMHDPLYNELKRHMAADVRRLVLKAQARCGHWWHGFR